MDTNDKSKKTEIKNILDEIKNMHAESECRLLRIVEGKEGNFDTYKNGLFIQFETLIKDYEYGDGITSIVVLNSAFEGLVKIVLFFNSPSDYLKRGKPERTLGNLKNDLLKIVKDNETDENKILLIKYIFDLIKELRNNFIHFPFYSKYDYRFEYMYFQIMAYLLKTNNLWSRLDNESKDIFQQKSQKKPQGTDLLGGIKLYETKN